MMTFEDFRAAMWLDSNVNYAVRQAMNGYDPETDGTRAQAEREFREQEIKALWNETCAKPAKMQDPNQQKKMLSEIKEKLRNLDNQS